VRHEPTCYAQGDGYDESRNFAAASAAFLIATAASNPKDWPSLLLPALSVNAAMQSKEQKASLFS
jgi:hypothetical protein